MHRHLAWPALGLVSDCISTEETRYYLNGVFWTNHNGKSRLVTTDGHHLAVLDMDADAPIRGGIFPRTCLAAVTGMSSPKGNGLVAVIRHDNHRITVQNGDRLLSTKLIEGKYPDYTRVIPELADDVDVVITKTTARRLASVMSERSQVCRISPKSATASVKLIDSMGELQIPIAAAPKGGPDIGFNTRYLTSMTATIGDLRLRCKGAGDPATITCEDHAYPLCILMPMRL